MIAYRGIYATDLPLPDDALRAFSRGWSAPAPRTETVTLQASGGRVLARDLRAATNVPEFARSAMDGFAVRAADVRGAEPGRPVFLTLAGEARPGARLALPERSVLRVATGAPLPEGADAVVRVEDAFVDGNAVGVAKAPATGADIVAAGDDLPAGTMVAPAGTVIGAALQGILASLGAERVEVYRRPSAVLLSTGDEVVPISTLPGPGEVRNSNGIVLTALLRSFGVGDIIARHVRDDVDALRRAIAEAADEHDAIVVSGGSSVGSRDFTAAALAGLPPPGVLVHGVRMKPGRPVLLAATGPRPIVGLPGNPTAAMLALMVFGAPIFAALTGRTAASPSDVGIAAESIAGTPGWACCVPVRLDAAGFVRPVAHRCSTLVSTLVAADGYVFLDAARPAIAAGDPVRVCRLP